MWSGCSTSFVTIFCCFAEVCVAIGDLSSTWSLENFGCGNIRSDLEEVVCVVLLEAVADLVQHGKANRALQH